MLTPLLLVLTLILTAYLITLWMIQRKSIGHTDGSRVAGLQREYKIALLTLLASHSTFYTYQMLNLEQYLLLSAFLILVSISVASYRIVCDLLDEWSKHKW